MLEFTQKFADVTIKMREASVAKTIAEELRKKLVADRNVLIQSVNEFVSGVYDVTQGHVVIESKGNISFYEKDCNA